MSENISSSAGTRTHRRPTPRQPPPCRSRPPHSSAAFPPAPLPSPPFPPPQPQCTCAAQPGPAPGPGLNPPPPARPPPGSSAPSPPAAAALTADAVPVDDHGGGAGRRGAAARLSAQRPESGRERGGKGRVSAGRSSYSGRAPRVTARACALPFLRLSSLRSAPARPLGGKALSALSPPLGVNCGVPHLFVFFFFVQAALALSQVPYIPEQLAHMRSLCSTGHCGAD